jgi:hypothetical protein
MASAPEAMTDLQPRAMRKVAARLIPLRVAHDPALERAPREEPRFTRERAPARMQRTQPVG